MSKLLNENDFKNASQYLGCEVAAIKAVAEVESPKSGFLQSGRPTILFEAHIFSKYTNHKYDISHPHISSRKWNKSLYKGGEAEYNRLEEAMKLDKIAALKSASWGKFQVMGFNYEICGWLDVETFVNDMYISEGNHLKAFTGFIKSNKLDKALRDKNWEKFALGYNGPGYKQNNYHIKMKNAYEKYAKENTINLNNINLIDLEDDIEVIEPKKPEIIAQKKTLIDYIIEFISNLTKK